MSRRFASTRLDKFDGVAYQMSALGLPLLGGALAHVECVTVNRHVEGAHTIFVGRVEAGAAADGEPLLCHRGRSTRFGGGSASPVRGPVPRSAPRSRCRFAPPAGRATTA